MAPPTPLIINDQTLVEGPLLTISICFLCGQQGDEGVQQGDEGVQEGDQGDQGRD